MTLLLLAFLGGALTILSPCILPVLPFVFARVDRPFARNGLPLLLGMAVSFAVVASFAAVAGSWAVQVNAVGRAAALTLLVLFGVSLLLPAVANWIARPFVAFGARLSCVADRRTGANGSVGWSLLLGVATGLLWAPCAGPILGLLLTSAALNGASFGTSLLLFAYAVGAAASLGLALFSSGHALAAMKRTIVPGAWLRRSAGAAVLVAVAAVASGLDTTYLSRFNLPGATAVEEALIQRAGSHLSFDRTPAQTHEDTAPLLGGDATWLNSQPLGREALRGKVVVVNFWTYSCINCLRTLPYLRAWAEEYKEEGLVVIGVHTPEFAFEKNIDNVRAAVRSLHVDYPVVIDNDFRIWRAFRNSAWPAFYFIDAEGRIRGQRFGEGDYADAERTIRKLLTEAGKQTDSEREVYPEATGAQVPAAWDDLASPESYLGFEKAAHFATRGGLVRNRSHVYQATGDLRTNQWALDGAWTIEPNRAVVDAAHGRILYRFHARDLHLVMGPAANGPVRIRVLLDGHRPGADHGADIDADGYGLVTEHRLYQLIRQQGPIENRDFQIEFLDPGAEAFAITFG